MRQPLRREDRQNILLRSVPHQLSQCQKKSRNEGLPFSGDNPYAQPEDSRYQILAGEEVHSQERTAGQQVRLSLLHVPAVHAAAACPLLLLRIHILHLTDRQRTSIPSTTINDYQINNFVIVLIIFNFVTYESNIRIDASRFLGKASRQ